MHFLGWDGFFESQNLGLLSPAWRPARVICEERGLYRVQFSETDMRWACVSGKMQFNADGRESYPAVGDWVLVDTPNPHDRGVIHGVYPRKTVIQRKQAGTAGGMQILAANVDTIFITTSLNEDLNHRRLERYLVMAWESGCTPVILLTKADLCADTGDVEAAVWDAQRTFPGVDVHALSQANFAQAEFFAAYLEVGKTAVVVGSSGVGKSTLVNYLIDDDRIRTQAIREDDARGRHTTTSRALYVSRFGGLVIDTPGMRELQLADHEEGVSAQFADIEEWAQSCRFNDCQHDTEPDCAVKSARANGELGEDRWASYLKLAAEVRFEMRKQDKALASEQRKLWKKRSKEAAQRSKSKRGG
ncbi:MAG: ribosome small subunit-dependent GTPase A [Bacteriovoracia bacterium]